MVIISASVMRSVLGSANEALLNTGTVKYAKLANISKYISPNGGPTGFFM
jgi:hypothetical protein